MYTMSVEITNQNSGCLNLFWGFLMVPSYNSQHKFKEFKVIMWKNQSSNALSFVNILLFSLVIP